MPEYKGGFGFALSSLHCPGVAFNDISTSPIYQPNLNIVNNLGVDENTLNKDTNNLNIGGMFNGYNANIENMTNEIFLSASCYEYKTIIQRLYLIYIYIYREKYCSLKYKDPFESCMPNFCSTCCKNESLTESINKTCTNYW